MFGAYLPAIVALPVCLNYGIIIPIEHMQDASATYLVLQILDFMMGIHFFFKVRFFKMAVRSIEYKPESNDLRFNMVSGKVYDYELDQIRKCKGIETN